MNIETNNFKLKIEQLDNGGERLIIKLNNVLSSVDISYDLPPVKEQVPLIEEVKTISSEDKDEDVERTKDLINKIKGTLKELRPGMGINQVGTLSGNRCQDTNYDTEIFKKVVNNIIPEKKSEVLKEIIQIPGTTEQYPTNLKVEITEQIGNPVLAPGLYGEPGACSDEGRPFTFDMLFKREEDNVVKEEIPDIKLDLSTETPKE